METLFIESNRETATSLIEIDNNEVPTTITSDPNITQNKASWNTTIDPLILEPGDQISLESASINIQGIGDGEKFNSFTGSVQTNSGKVLDKKDNAMKLEVNFYINNNNQFSIPLPLGTATRHDSVGGFFNKAVFGCPCLTGKNIWGTLFNEYVPNVPYSATTVGEKQAEIDARRFINMNSYNNEWSMGRGQYFYTTQAQGTFPYDTEKGTYENIQIPQTPAPSTTEKRVTCEIAGFLGWTNNTPIWGLQGCQFHQAVGYMEDTINKNISNRDNGIFVRDLQGEPAVIKLSADTPPVNTVEQGEIPNIQGGACGYNIIPGGIWNENAIIFSRGQGSVQLDGSDLNTYYDNVDNAVAQAQYGNYQYSLAKVARNCLPYNYHDFKENKTIMEGRFVYNDPMVIESTKYKGGLNTTAPNGQKLFCPNYIDFNLCNLGPYYNAITNDTRPTDTTPNRSLLYYRDYPNNNRNSNYFNYLKQEINLEVPEGNISSQRVADLLTQELKDRQGTTDNLSNGLGISPAVYTAFPNQGEKNTDLIEKAMGVAKKILPTIASKTYQTFPTLTGLIWESAYQSQYDTTASSDADPTRFNRGWNCIEPEVDCEKNEKMGSNYDANQAYDKFWKLMLCGNPNEWKSICWLNPMIQSTPFTQFQITDIYDPEDYYKYSIYTGQTPEFSATAPDGSALDLTNSFYAVRKGNNGVKNTTSYMTGQYGCQSCLLEGGESLGKNNILVSRKTRAFMCDWYLGGQTYTKTLSSTHYDTFGRSARSAIFSEPLQRLKYKPSRLEMFVTNIIFDGNIDIGVMNDNYNLVTNIEKNENSQNNILSQSHEFFDSNYVNWVVGRIDDAYSYPGTMTHNISTYNNYKEAGRFDPNGGLCPPTPNRQGVCRFLPNIFQTYKMYLQQPYNNQLQNAVAINLPSVELATWKERDYTFGSPSQTVQVGGNYAFCNEALGTESANMSDATSFSEVLSGQSVFRTDTLGYREFCFDSAVTDNDKKEDCGKMVFGLPTYSTSADDYVTDYKKASTDDWYKQSENKNQNPSLAYQKGLRRSLKGFKFLPQVDNTGSSITYWNANDAWHEKIPLPESVNAKFTTKPRGTVWNYEKFKALWDKLLALNEGKGIGCIPIFYKTSALSALKMPGSTTEINNNTSSIPFLAVILTGNQEEILLPETGESISLHTTPSLSQNTLAMPCSTQQINLQTDLQRLGNTTLVQNGETDVRNNYYQQNVGVQDGYNSQSIIRTGDATRGVPQTDVRSIDGFVPSKSTNLTQFLGSGGKCYSPVINIGANDIAFEYDAESERFSFKNLHTAMTTGNGVFQLASFGANASPETQIETAYVKTSAFSQQVNLPCGYFQKKNDLRPFTKSAQNTQPSTQPSPATPPPFLIGGGKFGITTPTSEPNVIPTSLGSGQQNPTNPSNLVGPTWGVGIDLVTNQNYNLGNGDMSATPNPAKPYVTQYNQTSPANYYAETYLVTINVPGGTDALKKDTVSSTDFFIPGKTDGQDNKTLTQPTPTAQRARLRILMAQSVDGNVIKQTFPSLSGITNRVFRNEHGEEIKSAEHNGSYEPGGLIASRNEQRNQINLPVLFASSLTKFIPNSTYMTPYDMNQFKLRCFLTPKIISGEKISALASGVLEYQNEFQFLLPPTVIPYAYIRQDSSPNVCNTSQAGIGIIGLSILRENLQKVALNNISYNLYKGTLLSKLGFGLNQFLPLFAQVQNILIPSKYNDYLSPNANAFDAYSNCVFPVTTNGATSTSDCLALVSGFGTASIEANRAFPSIQMPMYNLGLIYPSGVTNQSTADITAVNSPQIITYPYLLCQSNIISGTAPQYIGGINGKTINGNVIASLQTNYAVGDFAYTGRSDLVFVVTKQTPITQIKTSITFPNGNPADSILGESSSLIYRIDFAPRDDAGDLITPADERNKK